MWLTSLVPGIGAGVFYKPPLTALGCGLALGYDLYLTMSPVFLMRDRQLGSGDQSAQTHSHCWKHGWD